MQLDSFYALILSWITSWGGFVVAFCTIQRDCRAGSHALQPHASRAVLGCWTDRGTHHIQNAWNKPCPSLPPRCRSLVLAGMGITAVAEPYRNGTCSREVNQVCWPLETSPCSLRKDQGGFRSRRACRVTAPSCDAPFLIPDIPSHDGSRRAGAALQCQGKRPHLSALLRCLDP